MTTSWTAWRVATGFWILSFVVAAGFLCTRTVDGTGATQNTGTRALSVLVLACAYLIPLTIQVIWARAMRRRETEHSTAVSSSWG